MVIRTIIEYEGKTYCGQQAVDDDEYVKAVLADARKAESVIDELVADDWTGALAAAVAAVAHGDVSLPDKLVAERASNIYIYAISTGRSDAFCNELQTLLHDYLQDQDDE